jgi:predicted nucleic acid-binding protein
MSDLYDTCVFIDYWKGDAAASALIDYAMKNPGSAYYCPISATELWQYTKLGRQEEIEFVALIRYFVKEAQLDTTASIKAGQWLRQYTRSLKMGLAADALIAATADGGRHQIRTRNVKHLKRFYSNVQTY